MAAPRLPPIAVKRALSDGAEIAFLDVREHGQYGEGHPFFAVSLPYSTLEHRASRLVPRPDTRCVLMDDGDGVADRAAAALGALGYTGVGTLEGGAPAWASAGFTLFKGVNVPSKAFGELVEHELGTPSISADELDALQAAGGPLLLLDGRAPSEYRKMTLPGALSCPNAELGYRLAGLVDDDATPVVVHCAGRTRSIIGAQTLALLDLPNPVHALRNGTQGWRLAGLELAHDQVPEPLPDPSPDDLERAESQGQRLIDRYRLPTVGMDKAAAWADDAGRTTYLFDVRTAEEFARGHLPGARTAPGGQLVQATDEKLAVRHARVVLYCDTGLRAATTALWLRGMGHDARVLDVDLSDEMMCASSSEDDDTSDALELQALVGALHDGATLLDASRAFDYRAGHIDGAEWVTRARLDVARWKASERLIVTGRERALVDGVARELRASGVANVDTLTGEPARWRRAGLAVVGTPAVPPDEACIDHLFFVHDRHDGNLDAARRYLEWELGLIKQLDEQERGVLVPPRAADEARARPDAS